MKPLVLALIPLSGAILFSPQSSPKKPDPSAELSKKFLNEAESILRSDPLDGEFGLGRLPTIHRRQSFRANQLHEKAAHDAIGELTKTHWIALVSFGRFESGVPQRRSMMSGYYQLNHKPLGGAKEAFDSEDEFNEKVSIQGATELYKTGKKSMTKTMTFAKRPAVVEFKAVYASSQACYKCHGDAPSDKPIGVLSLIRVPKP